jgi:glycosyltransferase involved in cell wall biosynthesis
LHPIHDRDDPPLLLFEEPYDGFRVIRLRHWQGLNPNPVLRDYENPVVVPLFRQVLADVQPAAIHFFHLRNLGSDLLPVAKESGAVVVVNLMDFWFLCPNFILLRRDGSLCDGPPDGGLGCVPCQYPELAAVAATHVAEPSAAAHATVPRVSSADPAEQLVALLQRKAVLLQRLALADHVVAPSRFLAAMFRHNGFHSDRLQVIPYGLEPGRVTKQDIARPRDPLRVAFAGVMSPWKAPHLLVEAARQVPGRLQVSLHGRTEEYMFRDYITALLAAAAPDSRIRFPGPFGREQLSQVLADADLLVVPSRWYENTPFVVLEAFAAGVPVVASDLGGLSELVRDGENGFLFPAGDVVALARILERCLQEPELVRRLRPVATGDLAANYDRFRALYG